MRSLKYKPRYASNSPTKKSKVEEKFEEEEEEPEVEEENDYRMDINTWRRKNGVGYYQKVFIIKGGYYELRRSLIERGWFEN